MGVPKGTPKHGGRKKGTPNKQTAAVKAALLEAFEGVGGVAELIAWAKKPANRGEFYKLWAKLVPTEIRNADGETFRVEMVEEIVDASVSPHEDTSQDDSASSSSAPVPP